MEIRAVHDLSPESPLGKDVEQLIQSQLKTADDLETILSSIGLRDGTASIVAGFVDGQLATMNAFMPQSFTNGSASLVGFQSGFSATSGAHRGKGYWPKLMSQSLELLASKGANFVYGFPNAVSQPLFEKKLGFETSTMRCTVLPSFLARVVSIGMPLTAGQFAPDLPSLTKHKLRGNGDILVTDMPGGCAFGRVRKRRGLNILDVGHVSSEDGDISGPIRELCRMGRAFAFRFEATAVPSVARDIKLSHYTRPVIFRSLDRETKLHDLYMCAGLADNF